MLKNKFKKLVVSLSILTLNACGISENIVAENNFQTFNTQSTYKPKHKFGLKINRNTPKVKFDESPKNAAPKKIDLRNLDSPVANQGQLGACTGFAIAKGLREFLLNKQKKQFTALSPLFLYYNERKREGSINEDAGAAISDGMNEIKENGIAPEKDWPYDITKFTIEPPAYAYKNAKEFKVKTIKPLRGITSIKNELNKQNPVVFGIDVYQSFDEAKAGNIPVPNVKSEPLLGGHAVFCVGYDDFKKVMIMKNSWGNDWGDKGYFYLPYEYFKLGLVDDAWTAE